jgi:hypothetical protein
MDSIKKTDPTTAMTRMTHLKKSEMGQMGHLKKRAAGGMIANVQEGRLQMSGRGFHRFYT